MLRRRSVQPLARIREEHRAVRPLCRRLEEDARDRAALEALREILTRHIALEEEVLLPRLLRTLPGKNGPVPEVREEHAEILSLLGEMAREPDPTRVARFAMILRIHIDREEDLLLPYLGSRGATE